MLTDNLGKGDINYGKLVMIQIARTMQLGSRTIQSNQDYRVEWQNSILRLEELLYPKIRKKDKWSETKEKIRKMGGNKKTIDSIEEWRKMFMELMELAQNADLLPAEGVTMYDEGLEEDGII